MVTERELQCVGDQSRRNGRSGAVARGTWAELRARAGARVRLEGDSAPSISSLARTLGMDADTLRRYLADIEEAGLLRLEIHAGRKPIWHIRALGPQQDLSSGPEVENLRTRSATPAEPLGRTCRMERGHLPSGSGPGPRKERQIYSRERGTGDADLWKSELGGLVVGNALREISRLRETDPASREVRELERIVIECAGVLGALPDSPDPRVGADHARAPIPSSAEHAPPEGGFRECANKSES